MEKNIVPDAVPGQVVAADADGIAVVTGDGLLVMEEIQLEGKKRYAWSQISCEAAIFRRARF